MKQTAVEWLIEQIKKDSNLRLRGFDIDGVGKKAKEMEKEQIIEAVTYGQNNHTVSISADNERAEQYYTETYKK